MPRKGARRAKAVGGDPSDADGLNAWMKRYLEALRVKNYSERTVENRESYLSSFIAWCEARSIRTAAGGDEADFGALPAASFPPAPRERPSLSFRAQHSRLVPVRGYFKWLTRQNVLLLSAIREEYPSASVPVILETLVAEGRLEKGAISASSARRFYQEPGLDRVSLRLGQQGGRGKIRLRWQAETPVNP